MLAKVLNRRETVLAIVTLMVLLIIGVLVYTQKLKPSIGRITCAVILAVAVFNVVYQYNRTIRNAIKL